MTTLTPQAGRRYRQAAAFLIHWRNGDIEGAMAIFREVAGDPEAVAGMVCGLASLTWEAVETGAPDAAMDYLRRVAETSAVIEVST